MSDIRDILELEQPMGAIAPTKEAIVSGMKLKKPKRVSDVPQKRPEGMHRELFALLCNDNRDSPPLAPSDTTQGYKQMKAKLGRKHVRSWRWVTFTNPARTDGATLNHWRRTTDVTKEYPFARFNKKVDVPTYTDEEYQMYLTENPSWCRQETDHLFDLCRLFDLRFIVIHDRYDRKTYKNRTIEEIKDRYYSCITRLLQARTPTGQDPPNLPTPFDASHETERKKQLLKLYNRTQDQVQEEEMLMAELRKIEMRKKEREKKQQDIHKLISAADNSAEYRQKREKKPLKKKVQKKKGEPPEGQKSDSSSTGVKFPENKGAGVFLRSAKMKMPSSVGTKKAKAVEQLLEELGVDLQPMPTDHICQQFNELRNEMILLYELKQAAGNCEFEKQTLKHRKEALAPTKAQTLSTSPVESSPTPKQSSPQSATPLIDAVTSSPGTPNARKRRITSTFLEQNNALKKTKRF